MSEASRVWQLVRGGEVLAELVVTGGDFPWLSAEVRPVAGFAGVRPLFDDELRRLEYLDEEPEQWEVAYRRIREVVRLLAPDGRPVPEFLLHIEGENAWWRWSDEPFPEGKTSRDSLVLTCRRRLAAIGLLEQRPGQRRITFGPCDGLVPLDPGSSVEQELDLPSAIPAGR
jgi:hypothetical protein